MHSKIYILVCCFFLAFGLIPEAHAIIAGNTTSASPPSIFCSVSASGGARTGLTDKIVGCVEDILLNTVTNTQFAQIRTEIKNVVLWLITIYIAIFGYQVALGKVRKPMEEIMTDLFKITFVAAFTIGLALDDVWPMFKNLQKGLIDLVSQYTLLSPGGAVGGQDCSQGGGAPYQSVWKRVDCVIASVLAADLHYGGSGVDMAVAPFSSSGSSSANPTPYALPSTVVGTMFTTVGGVIIFLTAATMLLVFIGFATAVVNYLMCVVAVIVLVTVAPIFIPLLLFEMTKKMFDTWLQALLAYTIQPAILFAYLAFMTHAMSLIIYGDGANFGLHPILAEAKTVIDDPSQSTHKVLLRSHTELKSGVTVSPTAPVSGKGTETSSSGLVFPTVELTDDQKARLLVNLIAVAMIAAVLNSFMFNVMSFGSQLAGIPFTFSMGRYNSVFSGSLKAITSKLK